MKVSYGTPTVPEAPYDEDELMRLLSTLFEMNSSASESLCEIILGAAKQKHGTMVVITPYAGKEAERLKSQCTQVIYDSDADFKSLISNITAIDGAILVDTQGRCSAIGVILDGMASENGTKERGARYNSAVRYVENHHRRGPTAGPCLAVVISEDGTIDVVPRREELYRQLLVNGLGFFESDMTSLNVDSKLVTAILSADSGRVWAYIDDDPSLVTATFSGGWTLLHLAAIVGHADIAAVLLAHGAKPESHEPAPVDAPLACAVYSRSLAMVKLLLNYGAPMRYNAGKWDPLSLARHLHARDIEDHLITVALGASPRGETDVTW